jgi:hypothetical protein
LEGVQVCCPAILCSCEMIPGKCRVAYHRTEQTHTHTHTEIHEPAHSPWYFSFLPRHLSNPSGFQSLDAPSLLQSPSVENAIIFLYLLPALSPHSFPLCLESSWSLSLSLSFSVGLPHARSLHYLTLPLPHLTLTLPYLTLPYLTLPYLTLPYLTLPYLTLPYLTLTILTLPL